MKATPARVAITVITVAIVSVVTSGRAEAQVCCSGSSHTFTVNDTTDAVDVQLCTGGTPVCAAANGKCTLRAAVMQANACAGRDTILVPPGIYALNITGLDYTSA